MKVHDSSISCEEDAMADLATKATTSKMRTVEHDEDEDKENDMTQQPEASSKGSNVVGDRKKGGSKSRAR